MSVPAAKVIATDNRLSVIGTLNFSTVASLRAEGDDWLREHAAHECYLDLSQVSLCNSAATTLILCWLRAANGAGKKLLIEGVSPTLSSMMDLGGLHSILSPPG